MTYQEALRLLGLTKGFSMKDLKKAYRAEALKTHPDLTGQDFKFTLVKKAYEHLQENFRDHTHQTMFRKHLVLDVYQKCSLTFEEACAGCIKTIKYNFFVSETDHLKCELCKGRGVIFRERQEAEACNVCSSARSRNAQKTIRIPPGAHQGSVVGVEGSGHVLDDRVGNLKIKVLVGKHKNLKRSGLDIVQNIGVTYSDFLLCGSVIAKTIHGDVKVDIPFGTFDGDKIVVEGRGIRNSKKSGNHVIKLKLKAPKSLTRKQVDALKSLKQAGL